DGRGARLSDHGWILARDRASHEWRQLRGTGSGRGGRVWRGGGLGACAVHPGCGFLSRAERHGGEPDHEEAQQEAGPDARIPVARSHFVLLLGAVSHVAVSASSARCPPDLSLLSTNRD